jgi:hypothetical protein
MTGVDLDRYRERADRFIADEDEEYYLHYSGQKEALELEPIYERYSDLTTFEQAKAVGEAANGGRGVRELWRFACERYIANLEREHAEKLAELEATLETTIDAQPIPYRELRPRIANEADREQRRRLEEALGRLTDEHLNPIYLEAVDVLREAARELGGGTYRDLYVDRFGWQLEQLGDQCRDFLDSTERLYEEHADRLYRERAGVGLAEAERWDTLRVFRGVGWDEFFPPERLLPALEWTLSALGVDLRSQRNVELDIEPRPTKDPRAFCMPIEVPERVVLVMKPIGGVMDWLMLFHEAGHAEHFANTSPDLKMEERRLGDKAVTEGWASLLERITSEPRWLQKMLDFPRPEAFAAEGAVGHLYIARRYAAKLLYELEFHAADDVLPLRSRYVALKIEPNPANYLADIDPSFYVSEYLRSWAFEAQLREYLRGRYGNEWFASRKAGGELVELWSEGQKPTADELLADVTGAELSLGAVADRVREALR